MSKNVKLNDTNYTGIITVQLPTNDGGTATFKDTDEITTPTGSMAIAENGTYDVTNYERVVVNIPASGNVTSDVNSYEIGTFTLSEIAYNYTYEHNLGRVPKFAIVYPISIEKNTSDSALHSIYAIAMQCILNGLGQENYNITETDSEVTNSPFAQWYGIGYALGVTGGSSGTGANSTYGTALEFTETTVTIGQQVKQHVGTGHLTVGTYGIIVG